MTTWWHSLTQRQLWRVIFIKQVKSKRVGSWFTANAPANCNDCAVTRNIKAYLRSSTEESKGEIVATRIRLSSGWWYTSLWRHNNVNESELQYIRASLLNQLMSATLQTGRLMIQEKGILLQQGATDWDSSVLRWWSWLEMTDSGQMNTHNYPHPGNIYSYCRTPQKQ